MKENYGIILWNKIINIIKNIFYFNVCAYCKKNIDNKNKEYLSLCQKCIDSISYIAPIKQPKTQFLIYALGKYDGVLRYIVTEKYRRGGIVYEAIKNKIIFLIDFFNIDFDCILPIPKTSINKLKHQFNQTHIIAKIIKKQYEVNIFEYIYTKSSKDDQAGKRYSERILLENDIFFIPDSKKVLLNKKKF